MRREATKAAALAAAMLAGIAAGAHQAADRGSSAADPAMEDARRAAAGRLLAASRFRDRQSVVLDESLRSARSDLTTECIDRATVGRSLADCRATAEPTPGAAARLNARRSDMLDEITTAGQGVYARRFTAAEMDEITRFFRTPVGRKYGDIYPQLLTDVQARKAAIVKRYLVEASRGGAR